MKRVVICIDPVQGADRGEVGIDASEKELEFLERLAAAWNEKNGRLTAEIEIEAYLPVEKRDETRP